MTFLYLFSCYDFHHNFSEGTPQELFSLPRHLSSAEADVQQCNFCPSITDKLLRKHQIRWIPEKLKSTLIVFLSDLYSQSQMYVKFSALVSPKLYTCVIKNNKQTKLLFLWMLLNSVFVLNCFICLLFFSFPYNCLCPVSAKVTWHVSSMIFSIAEVWVIACFRKKNYIIHTFASCFARSRTFVTYY